VFRGGVVKVDLKSLCAKHVRWSVFSAAYRKIGEWEIEVSMNTPPVQWNLTDSKGKRVAPGLYYMVFIPEGQKRQVLSIVVLP
jgi:hypothetical protein